jgi:hypothetical protein
MYTQSCELSVACFCSQSHLANATRCLSRVASQSISAAAATLHFVRALCLDYKVMPDFLGYLYHLGPFTQQSLAYNSFRNGNLYQSPFRMYNQRPQDGQDDKSAFEVCYLLKFVESTPKSINDFVISHVAVYHSIWALTRSLCIIIEDSSHALKTSRVVEADHELEVGDPTSYTKHAIMRFCLPCVTKWSLTLDHLENFSHDSVSSELAWTCGIAKSVIATPQGRTRKHITHSSKPKNYRFTTGLSQPQHHSQ